ncbi:MAPK regulated corepressor interacting protein 2 isoform X5 [Choloepus didactylus]|uniref:MAPK regulated corepressor interacting protein 2 isoform X5 n=1 Tax=Choloepus didactylus TaxID=27675 RepID=UPI00189FA0E4|nr:MAPK regulated corepressor interacting protein 2 isoform X5 [Choloepus didactylus]
MYTITKGPSKLVAQRRKGPPQQQVESRLGELLKCRQPAPPPPPPSLAAGGTATGRQPSWGERAKGCAVHGEDARPPTAGPLLPPPDFVPIDLDEWWAQQFLARITNCS